MLKIDLTQNINFRECTSITCEIKMPPPTFFFITLNTQIETPNEEKGAKLQEVLQALHVDGHEVEHFAHCAPLHRRRRDEQPLAVDGGHERGAQTDAQVVRDARDALEDERLRDRRDEEEHREERALPQVAARRLDPFDQEPEGVKAEGIRITGQNQLHKYILDKVDWTKVCLSSLTFD